MRGFVRKIGDRALERLVPGTTAQADTSFYKKCYCDGPFYYAKLCHVVGGQTGCGGCRRTGEC